MSNLTEMQAIAIGKHILSDPKIVGFTMSLMNKEEAEDYIWGYLYDMGLQYLLPIDYIDENGNNCVVLIHQHD